MGSNDPASLVAALDKVRGMDDSSILAGAMDMPPTQIKKMKKFLKVVYLRGKNHHAQQLALRQKKSSKTQDAVQTNSGSSAKKSPDHFLSILFEEIREQVRGFPSGSDRFQDVACEIGLLLFSCFLTFVCFQKCPLTYRVSIC